MNQPLPIKPAELKRALSVAEAAARAAGKIMRDNLRIKKKINESSQHDIKLELDVRCQKKIEQMLRKAFPETPILGEEGITGDPTADHRWVVDPIDGTVNFTYEIPHACVSIALQSRMGNTGTEQDYKSVVGVVYDPFCDELWTAIRGGPAKLNGIRIQVSNRAKLSESIVALGFAKNKYTLEKMLPAFNDLIHRVRKIRMMGAAALSMVYVASGRMDAYLEFGLRLWDIAAGGLIIECAGGEFFHEPVKGEYTYRLVATNGKLRKKLEKIGQ
jgi:myo-inositol-1(or 4)-monophosphatase